MSQNEALLMMWITFTFFSVVGISVVIVWAVRSRQFSNQDRARYLALICGIPGSGPDEKTKPGKAGG